MKIYKRTKRPPQHSAAKAPAAAPHIPQEEQYITYRFFRFASPPQIQNHLHKAGSHTSQSSSPLPQVNMFSYYHFRLVLTSRTRNSIHLKSFPPSKEMCIQVLYRYTCGHDEQVCMAACAPFRASGDCISGMKIAALPTHKPCDACGG